MKIIKPPTSQSGTHPSLQPLFSAGCRQLMGEGVSVSDPAPAATLGSATRGTPLRGSRKSRRRGGCAAGPSCPVPLPSPGWQFVAPPAQASPPAGRLWVTPQSPTPFYQGPLRARLAGPWRPAQAKEAASSAAAEDETRPGSSSNSGGGSLSKRKHDGGGLRELERAREAARSREVFLGSRETSRRLFPPLPRSLCL